MQRFKVMRAIAAASVIAMTVTSMPVMAAEVNEVMVLDDGRDELVTLEDDFEGVITQSEEFVTEEADEDLDFSTVDDEALESGIYDTTPPEPVDAWFGSADKKVRSINVTHSDTFELTTVAKDDLSGVKKVNIRFMDAASGVTIDIDVDSNEYYSDGIRKYYSKGELHSDKMSVSGSIPAGTYKVVTVEFIDHAGNYIEYGTGEFISPVPSPYNKLEIVVSDKPAEGDGIVSELSVNPTAVNGGETISAKGKFQGKGELPYSFAAIFANRETGRRIYIDLYNNDGSYVGSKTIGEYEPSGKYVLDHVTTDINGKDVTQYAKGSGVYGKAGYVKVPDSFADLSFTVQNTKVDKTAPVLKGIKFDSTTVNVPGKFMATVDATDDASGLSSVLIEFIDSSNGMLQYFDGSFDVATKRYDANISQYTKSTTYTIDSVRLEDKAGNYVMYYAHDIGSNWPVMPEAIKKIVLTVKNDGETTDGKAVAYTTSTLSDSLVDDIKTAPDNSSIHVDCSGWKVLPKAALSAIKGTNKTLLLNSDNVQYELNGKNVTDASKDWNMASDVNEMRFYGESYKQMFGTDAKSLPCVKFDEAGALPGKVKIRVTIPHYYLEGLIGVTSNIYAYSYTKESDTYMTKLTLTKIAGPLSLTTDGNLEFEISSIPQEIFFAPGAAKVTSGTFNKYSVVDKFSDVENKWYAPFVQKAIDKGYMSGLNATTFAPNAECNRAMMVQILYNAKGVTGGGTTPFKDAQSGWFVKAVGWAYNNKVTTGLSPTEFGVNTPVTREQIAQFLYNYAAMNGYNVTDAADLSKFSDAADVSGWATKGMKWANAKQIVNGTSDKKLLPKKTATRAEVAAMVVNYMENIEKK